MKKITLLALLSVLLAPFTLAASSEQKLVPLEYKQKVVKGQKVVVKKTKKSAAQAVPKAVYDCKVSVEPLADERNNKVTLGSNWAEPLLPEGLDTWLDAVRTKELVNKTSSWAGDKQLVIKPSVLRLYSYAESMNIHGVIALNVEYWVDGKLLETKYYRGMGSKANMMNALGEYATALNYAVHEVAPDLLQDIKQICSK